MTMPVMLLLIGSAYVVMFGGLSWLRREGLSLRFALESVAFTVLLSALNAGTGFTIQPVLFLVLLYLITMRVRLLTDIGNQFAKRGQFNRAEKAYQIAASLWPDSAGKLIVQINQATALIKQNHLDQAIAMLKNVLAQAEHGFLSIKYESAVHYNLGVAYQKKGQGALAVSAFNMVLDTWPTSIYARSAMNALKRHRKKSRLENKKHH